MAEKALERKKLVVVGDGATGKTCMLIRFAEDKFTEEYIPTIFENRAVKINVRIRVKPLRIRMRVKIRIWSSVGSTHIDRYS